MGNWLDKIRRVFLSKRQEYEQERNFRRVAKRTRVLKSFQRSDLKRWKNDRELSENWNERIELMAGMVPENARVIEFGAGKMALKKYLPSNCEYQGADIIKRSPEMLVCDLNEGIGFSLAAYDTAVFSGVLEYVYDIDKVFELLNEKIGLIILSYACEDAFSENRERKGWLSDYKKEELEAVFQKYDYKIRDYREWRRQSIYKLEKDVMKASGY